MANDVYRSAVKSREELCEMLRSVTCRVIAQSATGLSAGSGVVINDRGWVLTAKHVVGRNPNDPARSIVVTTTDRSERTAYEPIPESFVSVDPGIPELMRPIDIDLALLRPLDSMEEIPFVHQRDDIPAVGTDVMMAGFSDDVYPTFNWDESLETRNPDVAAAKAAIDSHFRYFLRQLLCKRAMIGNVGRINIQFKDGELIGATYTLDADLTHGGSGGPVIDYEGRLIGIVCRKGLTAATRFGIQTVQTETLSKLPSTTAFALSHKLLIGTKSNK